MRATRKRKPRQLVVLWSQKRPHGLIGNKAPREIDALAGTTRTSKLEAVDEQASTAHSLVSPTVYSEKPATNLNPCQEKSSTSAQGHCVAEKFVWCVADQ